MPSSEIDMETQRQQKNENEKGVEIPVPRVFDEEIRRLLGPTEDDKDDLVIAFHILQKTERAFRERDRQYRETVNSVKDVIFRVDNIGRLVFLNRAWEELTGNSVVESMARPIFEFIHPDDYQPAIELFSEFINSDVSQCNQELRFLSKRDGFRWIEMQARLITDENNNVIGMAGTLRDVTERKKSAERIDAQIQKLSALRAIDLSIASSLDLRVTLSVLLEYITSLLNVDAANVLLFNSQRNELEFTAQRGFRNPAINRLRLKLGENFAGRAALDQQSIYIPDLRTKNHLLAKGNLLDEEGFISYFAIPLISKGELKGVLEVFHRSQLAHDEEWVEFLEALACQTAIAIDNAELFRELQRSNTDLKNAYDATIEGWSKALDLRDKETEGHTRRVTELTVALACAMGFDESELIHIRRGSLLHDIGKLGVPDFILLKKESLSEEEWAIMKKHPQYARDMLLPITFLRQSLDIPCFHHEKWDGSGYPNGLKGETIPLSARIFAIVDVWDALTSQRPYRMAWSKESAMAHIKSLEGTHFDPAIVDVFLNFIMQVNE
jgi:PAS domain S-box-containing protein